MAPPVFKTYAGGFARLRQVTRLANSRVFRHRGYAQLRRRSWEWALGGHSRAPHDGRVDALVQSLTYMRGSVEADRWIAIKRNQRPRRIGTRRRRCCAR